MSVFIIGVNCKTKMRMSLHIYNFKLDSYKKFIFKALEFIPCPSDSNDFESELKCTSIFGNSFLDYIPCLCLNDQEVLKKVL